MDNENKNGLPDDTSWLDELFGAVEQKAELGTDDGAAPGHDMSSIDDLELEEIMREALAETFPDDITPDTDIPIPEIDDEYRDDFEDDAEDEPDEDEDDEPEDPDAPVRKVRPKAKKGYGLFGIPHLVATAIWLVLAIVIGVSRGTLLWVCASDVLAFGRPNQSITITITADDTVDSVTDKLHDAGLIKYKDLFKLYAGLAKADQKISAGTYVLNTQYDYHALVNGMTASSSYRETVKIQIPEGYSSAQIYALLESKGVCTVATLEEYASTSEFASYPFLEGVTRGSKYCLEGFLFPDTYEFYTNDTPQRIFDKMLSRFGNQVDDELLVHLDTLNEKMAAKLRKNGYSQSYIDANKLTLYNVITMASIVQKESAHTGENYDIASVFYNRLANPNAYPFLNSDATVVYALGGKQDLTPDDYKVNSPYNTYVVKGLPVGPIANPGLSSIMAALGPADTNYHYFVLDPSIGEHLFSVTLKEHQDKVDSLR